MVILAIDHFRLIINIDIWACRLLLSLTSPMSVLCLFLFVSWCRLLLRHLWGAIAMGLEIATRWVVNVGHNGRASQPVRRCWHRWCRPWPLMVICRRPWANRGHFNVDRVDQAGSLSSLTFTEFSSRFELGDPPVLLLLADYFAN